MTRHSMLATLTVSSAAALVAARRLSPVELTEAALAAIAAQEPEAGAFAALDRGGLFLLLQE